MPGSTTWPGGAESSRSATSSALERNSTVLVMGAVGLIGSRLVEPHLLYGRTVAGGLLRFVAGTMIVK
jgi:hypothetical protein